MTLNTILAAFALLSLALTLWQWLAARRFPLHWRAPNTGVQPGVTLLKPLKGSDAHTEACLRSWFVQEYGGETQILFGVASAEDLACGVVKKLLAEFPRSDAQLVVCPAQLGPNAKVSKLAQLEPLAKHEIIVVSDADVRAPTDLLANLVAVLRDDVRTIQGSVSVVGNRSPGPPATHSPINVGRSGARDAATNKVGLVNCFYRLANPTTLAMQWEAIAINADFWSQVLQSASFRRLDFALGAVMATRHQQLAEIGGFKALVDCLADDYQLGHRIAQSGHRVELCPVVVDCWSAPMGWRAIWKHQLRWARSIRVCQSVPYFFSILKAWLQLLFLKP